MKTLLVVAALAGAVWASSFSEGVRLFKKGAYKEAKHYFDLAYEEDGVVTASYFLGLYYLRGLGGVEKNYNLAKRYLERAASLGNVRAECALAELYLATDQQAKAQEIITRNSSAKECQELQNKTKKDK